MKLGAVFGASTAKPNRQCLDNSVDQWLSSVHSFFRRPSAGEFSGRDQVDWIAIQSISQEYELVMGDEFGLFFDAK